MNRTEVDATLVVMHGDGWTSGIGEMNALVFALEEQRDAAERLAKAERTYRVALDAKAKVEADHSDREHTTRRMEDEAGACVETLVQASAALVAAGGTP